jgi:1-phosphofructokinase
VIVTVTPNPSIDRTLEVPAVLRGEVIRVRAASSEAGGKGINVSRALAVMGVPTMAIAPASVATRSRLDDLLGGSTPLRTIPIDGEIRVNLSLVEPDGTVTKVNEPGPTLSEREAAAFVDAVVAAVLDAFATDTADADAESDATRGLGALPFAPPGAWVVGCGSLPPGLPDGFYALLAARLPATIQVAVDADRSALRAVVHTPIALLKPNRAELEEVIGRDLPTLGDVADAAAELVAAGAERVLVSLGPDGALVVDRSGACHAEAVIDDVANTVGAGDALLAGFLAAGATAAALPTAVAWSVAACRSPGTRMPGVASRDESAVIVRPSVDRTRWLVP